MTGVSQLKYIDLVKLILNDHILAHSNNLAMIDYKEDVDIKEESKKVMWLPFMHFFYYKGGSYNLNIVHMELQDPLM